MLITEKVKKLRDALTVYEKAAELYPDAEITEVPEGTGFGTKQYLISETVMRTSEEVEFLTPQGIENTSHRACIYADVIAENDCRQIKLRAYGWSKGRSKYPFFSIELFVVRNNALHCYDYQKTMQECGATEAAIRKAHVYVVEFLKNNIDVKVDKKKLPNNIQGLMAFI